MKKSITLHEAQLRGIITESIKKVLNEMSDNGDQSDWDWIYGETHDTDIDVDPETKEIRQKADSILLL